MAEVFVRFTESVRGTDGHQYLGQVCGGVADDGLWEGWIEFASPHGPAVRTPRETEQPNRDALVYWAEGLSVAYLEGALRRALDTIKAQPVRALETDESIFPGPAGPSGMHPVRPHSVLEPFSTYAQGEGILRQQLMALSRDHLLTLIEAHQLKVIETANAPKEDLVERIVRAVKLYSASV